VYRHGRRRHWNIAGGRRAPSQKIYEFFVSNGMIWCILGVLFSRFMCPVDFSFTMNFIEVLLKGKNKTLVKILGGSSTQDDPCGSNIGEGVATTATPAVLTPMCIGSRDA